MKAQPSVAAAINHQSEAPAGQRQPFVGSWSLEGHSQRLNGVFPMLWSLTSDGIMLANKASRAFESTVHGSWISTGQATAAFTFKGLIGSESGALSVSFRVIGIINYDAATDTIQGSQKVFQDGDDAVVDRTTFHGIRIAVEALTDA